MVKFPLTIPFVVGVKLTAKVHLALAASVPLHGLELLPTAEKSPLVAHVNETLWLSLLVSVMVCATEVDPTFVAAKLRLFDMESVQLTFTEDANGFYIDGKSFDSAPHRSGNSRSERHRDCASLPWSKRGSAAIAGLRVATAGDNRVDCEVNEAAVRHCNRLPSACHVQNLVAKGERARAQRYRGRSANASERSGLWTVACAVSHRKRSGCGAGNSGSEINADRASATVRSKRLGASIGLRKHATTCGNSADVERDRLVISYGSVVRFWGRYSPATHTVQPSLGSSTPEYQSPQR